ncbi:MAG: tyrosine--tRNA ligase [Chloroflexota bacterium]|nr:tyrosine--tRNA ligase [Chloroflexota bacterium]
MPANAFDVLDARGLISAASDAAALRRAFDRPLTFYVGFDPTASSLTAGHLVTLMMAHHLEQAGHRPILIAGGGTGMIGDPSDRLDTRALLTEADVAANVAAIRTQLERFVDLSEGDALVLNNADWLSELGYLGFLRDIGRHFSVNEMLATDTYRNRLEAGENLNFIELNYRLLQAYDFLHLYREYDCTLQIAGSDQWSNILAGVDLIRRVERTQAFGLVAPLLTTAEGAKMGKTAAGAVWLDADRTSPFDFYQHWINLADALVPQALGMLTTLPMSEVAELRDLRGPDVRRAKQALAHDVTATVHGREAADAARESARSLFAAAAGDADAVPTTLVAAAELDAGISVVDLLVRTGLAPSRAAARRLIAQGGAYVGEARAEDAEATVTHSQVPDDGLLLRAGRKRYHRVVVGP